MKKIKLLEVFIHNQAVGKIALTNQNLCAFEYDNRFLSNGFSISPFELPLKNGVFVAKHEPFQGNFGVFDDCLPDGWGMLILDRFLQNKGIQPNSLSILDKLSLVGTTGRGALQFHPDQSVANSTEFLDFETLANEAQNILTSKVIDEKLLDTLYRQGGSPGGARPKVFAKTDNREWMVKFRANYDPENIGKTEYDYSILAKKCGIHMPETRLFDGKFFGVERFDRINNEKIHIVSVAGLLQANYRIPSLDYLTIFQLCQNITRNMQEMWKLYRLMVFNFLIGNKDDHAKNFAFMHIDNEWLLTPAFDILPSDGINGFHTTSINNSITPTENDILAVAQKAGLDKNKAISIFEEIKSIVHEELN